MSSSSSCSFLVARMLLGVTSVDLNLLLLLVFLKNYIGACIHTRRDHLSAHVNSGDGVSNQIDFNLIEDIFAHVNTANEKLPRSLCEGKLTKCKTMNF